MTSTMPVGFGQRNADQTGTKKAAMKTAQKAPKTPNAATDPAIIPDRFGGANDFLANPTEGLYFPLSMATIVCRVMPTRFAGSCWVILGLLRRYDRTLFVTFSDESMSKCQAEYNCGGLARFNGLVLKRSS